MNRDEQGYQTKRNGEEGFALVLAMLSLLVLTFLGLTLATTTTTEMQIAANYRWSQQAYYAAEAGIEAGKIVLRNLPTNWAQILYPARIVPWSTGSAPAAVPVPIPKPDAFGNLSRNFENRLCDTRGGMGYGLVLDDTQTALLAIGGVPQTPGGPYQNISQFLGQTVNGSFTLWVRRELAQNNAGLWSDEISNPPNSVLVLTSEGVAPAQGRAPVTVAQRRQQVSRAVRVLSIKLNRGGGTSNPCTTPGGGQIGAGAAGTNFQACATLTGAGLVTALGGAGAGGFADLPAGGGGVVR